MGSDPIDGGVSLPRGCGIAALVLFCIRFDLVRDLARHGNRVTHGRFQSFNGSRFQNSEFTELIDMPVRITNAKPWASKT